MYVQRGFFKKETLCVYVCVWILKCYLCVQVSARGEVTIMLPPKLELHCPTLVVANRSLELTLVSWGSVGLNVDWKITKDDVQIAKGKVYQHAISVIEISHISSSS